MAKTQKPPRVVAELGRPETAHETAARKAENSRLYKQRKTVNNLVFSLLVSVAVMIVLVLIVPRGTDIWSDHSVDVAESARETSESTGHPLVAPEVPESWKAKQAHLRTSQTSDILHWYIGFTTENEAYAAVVQAFTRTGEAINETWIAQQLEEQAPTGTETIGGINWTVYDHPKRSADETNVVFGMEARIGDNVLLVYGTDRPEVLRTLAAAVAAQATALDLDSNTTGATSATSSAPESRPEETA